MKILVDIKKEFASRGRAFSLDVSFSSDRDFVVLFGPSGAGKSLTLQAIAGLVRPDRGRIVAGERTLLDTAKKIDIPARLRDIGYVPQDYALFPHLTVAENVGFGLKKAWHWRMNGKDRQRVAEVLELFGLEGLQGSLPQELSGGQQQRVALARALIRRPGCCSWMNPLRRWTPCCEPKCAKSCSRFKPDFPCQSSSLLMIRKMWPRFLRLWWSMRPGKSAGSCRTLTRCPKRQSRFRPHSSPSPDSHRYPLTPATSSGAARDPGSEYLLTLK
jgi:molybdate transport system ATP-binding protein